MFELIRDILAKQLGSSAEIITPEADIAEDLGADSLDVAEMLVTVEDDLGIMIPDDDVIAFRTVGDVVIYLENRKN